MTTANTQFFAILTAVGEAKQANADALGIPWSFSQMGVGDANGTDPIPDRTQVRLINERRRAPLNAVKIDPANANIIIAEQVIPPDVGGWWIREIGLYDAAGDLVAVANCAPSFKPLLSQGTGKTQVVRLNIIVTSTANVQLKIDPAVVLATREYVDAQLANYLPENKSAGTYTKITINARGVVMSGANPTTLAGYGITDALQIGVVSMQRPVLSSPTVGDTLEDSALVIREARGSLATQRDPTYAPSISFYWYGVAAGRLMMSPTEDLMWRGQKLISTVEQDQLTQQILKKAPLESPRLTGKPLVPTAPSGTDDETAASTAFVRREVEALVGAAPGALDTLDELAEALGNDPNFATSIATSLAGKADKATTLGGYGILDGLRVGAGIVSRQQPTLAASSVGVTLSDSALVIREALEVAEAQSSDSYAPAIGFFWKNKAAGRLAMDVLGRLKWGDKPLITGRVASQTEVDTGTGDDALVPASRLRWGFYFQGGENGCIALPTWLGGFVLQWGVARGVPQASTTVGAVGPTRDVTLPMAFPVEAFRVFASMDFTTMAPTGAFTPGANILSRSVIRVQNNYTASAGDIAWFAVGR
jgi:phage-related tail fiber protein